MRRSQDEFTRAISKSVFWAISMWTVVKGSWETAGNLQGRATGKEWSIQSLPLLKFPFTLVLSTSQVSAIFGKLPFIWRWRNICRCRLKMKWYNSKQKNFVCHCTKSRNANSVIEQYGTKVSDFTKKIPWNITAFVKFC